MKRQQNGKKSLQAIHQINDSYPEYIKAQKINPQRANNQVNEWAN
jgi:hypothetical protein